MWSDLLLILDATLRMAVPLVLAAMGGFSRAFRRHRFWPGRKMLGGAFVAATVAHLTQSAWMGLLGAIIIGITFSMMHAFASVTKQGNQVVSCVAINIFAMGLTTVLGQAWFQRGGKTPQLPPEARFTTIELPFAEELRVVPVLGDIYYELISGHNILVYIAYIMVPLTAWIVFRSRFGLRLRATGENPLAVDTAGISVNATRYKALIINGILGGMSGRIFPPHSLLFCQRYVCGQGLSRFGSDDFWKMEALPGNACVSAFAFAEAIQSRLQGVPLPIVGVVPVQLIQSIPYILTVVLLAGFVGKAVAPKAIGEPFIKEHK